MARKERFTLPALIFLLAASSPLGLAIPLFLRAMHAAQLVTVRTVAFWHGGLRLQDDPRVYRPGFLLIAFGIGSALIVFTFLTLYRGRAETASGLARTAGLVLILVTLAVLVSHSLLYPCFDESTLYNCDAFIGGDGVTGAAGLIALADLACWSLVVWLNTLPLREVYGNQVLWHGPRY